MWSQCFRNLYGKLGLEDVFPDEVTATLDAEQLKEFWSALEKAIERGDYVGVSTFVDTSGYTCIRKGEAEGWAREPGFHEAKQEAQENYDALFDENGERREVENNDYLPTSEGSMLRWDEDTEHDRSMERVTRLEKSELTNSEKAVLDAFRSKGESSIEYDSLVSYTRLSKLNLDAAIVRLKERNMAAKTPGSSNVFLRAYGMRIPAHREHLFWFSVNTDSGSS